MKTLANLNLRRTSIFAQIETSKQIIKTPKIEIPPNRPHSTTQILALDSTKILAPDLSSLTPINFQQNVSSNFELF
jgi:hypothetical protein